MLFNNDFTSVNPSKLVKYGQEKIERHSTSKYEHMSGFLTSKINKLSRIVTAPIVNGIYWSTVAKNGAGGANRKFAWLKAAASFAVGIATLPIAPIGFIAQICIHSGTGKDTVKLVDATKNPKLNYDIPVVNPEDPLPMMTYNVAWSPSPMDVILDVTKSAPRATQLAKWLKQQPEEHLPMFIGMQEAFDISATKVFANDVRDLYPYAVTGAGWANNVKFGSSSGLQFYSRLPIKNVEYYPFQDLEGLCARSARGYLRVEVQLNDNETTVVYVTHTQAFEDEHDASIRANEITLIVNQSKVDREVDRKKGKNVRGYYLMGDLNVEHVQFPSKKGPDRMDGSDVEYWRLFAEDMNGKKGPLHPDVVYDPFYEDHDLFTGERASGKPTYLESDTQNAEREKRGWDRIEEKTGSFYKGAYCKKDPNDYGTEGFFTGPQPTLEKERLDFIVELLDESKSTSKGKAELRNVIPDPLKGKRYPVSDHMPLQATFSQS